MAFVHDGGFGAAVALSAFAGAAFAGAGTLGLEILEDVPDVDAVIGEIVRSRELWDLDRSPGER